MNEKVSYFTPVPGEPSVWGLVQKPREKSEMFVRRKFQDVKEPKFKTLSHSLCVDSVQ